MVSRVQAPAQTHCMGDTPLSRPQGRIA
ncbi:hypothetical protein EMIT0347P_40613 [Pseudomonas sp. IT-347P]